MNKYSYDNMKGRKKMKKHDHSQLLSAVGSQMPEDETLAELSELFSVFGDSTRIKILWALFEHEMCVCAIAELLKMTQSAISHQLKLLRHAKLVSSRREGKTIYYFLADDHVRSIINQGMEHISE